MYALACFNHNKGYALWDGVASAVPNTTATSQYILLQCSCSLQWNPSKTDTIRTKGFVLYSKVSLAQGLD